ncbi:hypothetical protein [uncultured Methanobacterium sp.]|nr:hypothetical protein [uncultured Methanobacterium sp.]
MRLEEMVLSSNMFIICLSTPSSLLFSYGNVYLAVMYNYVGGTPVHLL